MAIPIAIPIVLTIASMAAQAWGAKKAGDASTEAGEAQRRAAESLADLSDYNAQVAELQAQDAITRGADEEARFRTSVRGLIGSQRAGFAAGNIDVGSGSAVDVQADAAFLGELDALQIRTNARREAWGYQVEAEDLRRRGEIARKEGVYAERAGRTTATAGYWGAGGSILASGASLLKERYGYGR